MMAAVLRGAYGFAAAAVVAAGLPAVSPAQFIAGIALWLLLGIAVRRAAPAEFSAGILLGIFCAILPLGVPGRLLVQLLLFIGFASPPLSQRALRIATPLFSLFAFAALLIAALDPALHTGVAALVSGTADRAAFSQIASVAHRQLTDLLRLGVLIHLILLFAERDRLRRGALIGAAVGAALALLVALLHMYGADPVWLMPAGNSFFEMQGRTPLTFTDPNAAGIFLFIAAGIGFFGFAKRRIAGRVCALLFAACCGYGALIAGSRTFFLGAFLAGAFLVFRSLSRRRAALSGLVLVLLLGVAVTVDLPQSFKEQLPGVFRRMAAEFDGSTESGGFFSRRVFNAVSLKLLSENPVTGIGFGEYRRHFAPTAKMLGYEVGAWSDNPNNLYLGWIVEWGAAGTLLLVLVAASFALRPDRDPAALPLLILFALLCFTGPHTDFDEVTVAAAAIVAAAFRLRGVAESGGWGVVWATAAALTAAAIALFPAPRGWYGWERDARGLYRWSSSTATAEILCRNGAAALNLANWRPADNRHFSQALAIRTPFEVRHLRLRAGEEREIPISCARNGRGVVDGSLRVTIEVSEPWSPAASGLGADSRILGVVSRLGP